MIKYIDGEMHIIDDYQYFYAEGDNQLPELQYALTLAIEALASEEFYNTAAVSTLGNLLRLTFPSMGQARFLSAIPNEPENTPENKTA